jgi:hypothetical protein
VRPQTGSNYEKKKARGREAKLTNRSKNGGTVNKKLIGGRNSNNSDYGK